MNWMSIFMLKMLIPLCLFLIIAAWAIYLNIHEGNNESTDSILKKYKENRRP